MVPLGVELLALDEELDLGDFGLNDSGRLLDIIIPLAGAPLFISLKPAEIWSKLIS